MIINTHESTHWKHCVVYTWPFKKKNNVNKTDILHFSLLGSVSLHPFLLRSEHCHEFELNNAYSIALGVF